LSLKDYDEVIAAARPALDDARKLRDELIAWLPAGE
jgi:hypothetical protein